MLSLPPISPTDNRTSLSLGGKNDSEYSLENSGICKECSEELILPLFKINPQVGKTCIIPVGLISIGKESKTDQIYSNKIGAYA